SAIRVVVAHRVGDFTAVRGQYGDETVLIFLDKLPIHARAIEKALKIGIRYYFQKILISRLILCEQDQASELVVYVVFFVVPGSRRDEEVHADDRFYALRFALFVELDSAVHGAVVGKRERFHAVLFGGGYELGDAGKGFEQGIMAMCMKVYEFCHARFALRSLGEGGLISAL